MTTIRPAVDRFFIHFAGGICYILLHRKVSRGNSTQTKEKAWLPQLSSLRWSVTRLTVSRKRYGK
jgi:hypothetical protein